MFLQESQSGAPATVLAKHERSSFFLMQGDIYLGLKLHEKARVVLEKSLNGTGEGYGLLSVLPWHGSVKAGRFLPNFGWNWVDHETAARRALGYGAGQLDTGVEVELHPDHYSLSLAVGNDNAGPLDGDPGKALTVRALWQHEALGQGSSAWFQVDLKSLDTGMSLRNKHMRENHMHTDKYPVTRFEMRSLSVPVAALAPGKTTRVTATGDYPLHGVTRSRTLPVDVTWFPDGSKTPAKAKGPALHVLCQGGLAGCADLGDEPGTAPVDEDVSFARTCGPFCKAIAQCATSRTAVRAGGLDLGSLAGLRAGGVSGAVVVPGAADSSLLVARLEESNPALRMPAGGQLPAVQIEVIRDWIDQGAMDN